MRALHYLTIGLLLATPSALGADASEAAAPAPRVADLAFIAGDWEGELFGGLADESWMSPRDGSMLGSFRLTWPDSGRRLYEFLIIEENAEGKVELHFRHFNPGMELWEAEVERPLTFELVEVGARRAVFDAPDRAQQPARFVFEGAADGKTLRIRVASLDESGAEKDAFEARYERR